ncbi:iron ABC transporter substrate-binding protein [Ureaplasma parvum]|uniref:iron ABC transporter substrate-binding protein n=1 Tax=Ureaplasma parvum TaxID=134821 RepID=UPI0026F15F86|nr:iron ABC transporter substrate-binding protein [Ureaplasma parvum]
MKIKLKKMIIFFLGLPILTIPLIVSACSQFKINQDVILTYRPTVSLAKEFANDNNTIDDVLKKVKINKDGSYNLLIYDLSRSPKNVQYKIVDIKKDSEQILKVTINAKIQKYKESINYDFYFQPFLTLKQKEDKTILQQNLNIIRSAWDYDQKQKTGFFNLRIKREYQKKSLIEIKTLGEKAFDFGEDLNPQLKVDSKFKDINIKIIDINYFEPLDESQRELVVEIMISKGKNEQQAKLFKKIKINLD